VLRFFRTLPGHLLPGRPDGHGARAGAESSSAPVSGHSHVGAFEQGVGVLHGSVVINNYGAATPPPPAPSPAEPPTTAPAGPDPLGLFRAHLTEAHSRLVPFFERQGQQALIEEVFVELAVTWGHRHTIDRLTLPRLLEGGDGLPRCGRWAVLGDPGAGKSTLARHLVWHHAATDDEPIAVYVGLADWAEFEGDPFDFAEAELRLDEGMRADGLAEALRAMAADEGRVFALFDGFDEIDPKLRQRTRQRIERFARKWSTVTVAVLSRAIGFDDIGGFSRAEVQKLDAVRQNELLTRWLGAESGTAAYARIAAEPALGDAAGNPLLLSLMARLADAAPDRALPATRGGLYGQALALLLARGHCLSSAGLGNRTEGARQLLRALSLALTEAGGEAWAFGALEQGVADRCARTSLERLLTTDWQNAEGFLKGIAHDTGIIGAHDGPTNRWRYLHRSLRER
ncbi:MAG: hypothetical protein KC620_25865, partial [Myxococcales bacterium]|nr:hypothetical protein [Myxococcales bacterium]